MEFLLKQVSENKSFQIINRKNGLNGNVKKVSLSFYQQSVEFEIKPTEIVEISCPNGAILIFECGNESMKITGKSTYSQIGPFNVRKMNNSQIEGITINF